MSLLEVILGLLSNLLASEIWAWMPRAAERLTRHHASRCPADLRERMHEEWLADLDAQPGHMTKVWFAVGLLRARWGINMARAQREPTAYEEWLVRKVLPYPLSFPVAWGASYLLFARSGDGWLKWLVIAPVIIAVTIAILFYRDMQTARPPREDAKR